MSVEKRTEDTFLPFIKEELEKRNVKVDTQVSYVVIDGRRCKPDAKLMNSGVHYLELELGPESKLYYEGLPQAADYRKFLRGDGAFAVLFPEELRKQMPYDRMKELVYTLDNFRAIAVFSDEDPRPSLPFEKGNLTQLADWIADEVLRPPVREQPPVIFPVRVIANAVSYLTAALEEIKTEELREIFGGKSVFDNILQYGEGQYPEDAMRRAAAYLLVNQILFYHVLQKAHERKKIYEPIDVSRIKRPGDLYKYFRKVLAVDYTPIFGFNVASKLPAKKDILQRIREVVRMILSLAPEKISHDILGQIFHNLIPIEIRKPLAAFYTNPEAAEMLAYLAIDKPDAKVMDLAVGSGTLLISSYHKKRMLRAQEAKFEAKDHKRFLEEDLTGIDIMPFAAHLAAVHLSLQEPLYETEKVRIAVWDSTELRPSQRIPSVSRELKEAYKQPTLDVILNEGAIPRPGKDAFVEKGSLTSDKIGGEEIPLEKVDLVIMNPPFTRQERLPNNYKQKLDDRFSEYRRYLHGQLGLHGFFILLGDRFLKPSGHLAFVLPATILRVRSTGGIRQYISEHYEVKNIITAWKQLAFSESAWVREILLIARKLTKDKRDGCSANIVTLRRLPRNQMEAIQFAEEIKAHELALPELKYESQDMLITSVSQEELGHNVDNWFPYVAAYDPRIRQLWMRIKTAVPERLCRFGDTLTRHQMTVNRGVETRSKNDVPVQAMMIGLQEERLPRAAYTWVVEKISSRALIVRNRTTGQTIEIAPSRVVPALLTYSGVRVMNIDGKNDFVVTEYFDEIERFLPIMDRQRILGLLSDWRQYVEDRRGNLLVCRRYVPSAPGFCHTCFYTDERVAPPGMMWSVHGGTPDDLKILALWINSTLHLSQVLLEKIQDVWIDVHEYVLNDLLVLNVDRISSEQKQHLVSLFNEVARIEWPSLREQVAGRFEPRLKMDEALLEILGLSGEEVKRTLKELYSAIELEFRALDMLATARRDEEY